VLIADLGLSSLADQSSTSGKNNIYRVLSYVAPEVLNGEPYTIASDINLAFKICEGVRPQ